MSSDLISTTNNIRSERYPDAKVVFLAGSIVRGEGTPTSDLDLVVVYESLPHAYRESFIHEGFPVESFVHDPETINYFVTEVDFKAGRCVLAQMITEGIEVPGSNELSRQLKEFATSVIDSGPPPLREAELRAMRYNITNLVDDIRHPRSQAEAVGTGTDLYSALANLYFRANGLWTAENKSIPRRLKLADHAFCNRFCESFERLFVGGDSGPLISLSEDILAPVGGFLFDGYKLDARPKGQNSPEHKN